MVVKKSAVKKLISEVSEMKVSPTVVDEVEKMVEEYIKETAEKLAALADHAGRKTIKEEDVKTYLSVK